MVYAVGNRVRFFTTEEGAIHLNYKRGTVARILADVEYPIGIKFDDGSNDGDLFYCKEFELTPSSTRERWKYRRGWATPISPRRGQYSVSTR